MIFFRKVLLDGQYMLLKAFLVIRFLYLLSHSYFSAQTNTLSASYVKLGEIHYFRNCQFKLKSTSSLIVKRSQYSNPPSHVGQLIHTQCQIMVRWVGGFTALFFQGLQQSPLVKMLQVPDWICMRVVSLESP
jgi:hypothetical protein